MKMYKYDRDVGVHGLASRHTCVKGYEDSRSQSVSSLQCRRKRACHNPSIYLSIPSHSVFPADIKYLIAPYSISLANFPPTLLPLPFQYKPNINRNIQYLPPPYFSQNPVLQTALYRSLSSYPVSSYYRVKSCAITLTLCPFAETIIISFRTMKPGNGGLRT